MDSLATPEHHKTGFLDLPVEIRLEIYAMLLRMPASSKAASHRPCSTDDRVHAGILLANRQINAEATDMLYRDNTFLAHPTMLASFPRLRSWYSPCRESCVVPRIRRFHVQVRLDCDLPYDTDAVAASFSGLEELSIDVVQAMFLGVGHRNLHRFERVRGVKHVRISGSTTGFDDYLRWLKAAMESDYEAKVDDYVPVQSDAWCSRFAQVQ